MEMFAFGPAGIMFSLIPVIVCLMFIIIIGIIIVNAIKGAKEWNSNNNTEKLTADAEVVTKRADVRRGHYEAGNGHHHSATTTYFATFEFKNGERLEFKIRSTEYGILAAKDVGSLTYQGTRYLGFERTRVNFSSFGT